MNKQIISVVIPIFNESLNLHNFYDRLNLVTNKLTNYNWEFIFVNDGSTDKSLLVLDELAKLNKKNKVIDLTRNFGKEIALTAGAHQAEYADAVICIDADLQHPPELIPNLIDLWVQGNEIVVTTRISIDKQPLLRRLGSKLFYFLMSKISGVEMKPNTTDYRLYDKKVIKAFRNLTERDRMFRGIMDWMGFKKTYLEFKADARQYGEAGYSYSKLWRLAINSITAFSLWPLRITGYIGIFITLSSGALLSWMLLNFIILDRFNYSPIAFIVVANTFLIGLVLMSIGLVSLYIARIHTEVVNRPLYIIRKRLNFPKITLKTKDH